MPLGYFGYAKLGGLLDTPATPNPIFLLTNSGGLNRQVNPILSDAVWGAGWYTGAATTNYADGQQHFEGSLSFELQGIKSVWDLIRDWAIENRVFPKTMLMSPNGMNVQTYAVDPDDFRTGAWLNTAGINIAPDASIKINANVKALRRTETPGGTSYRALSGKTPQVLGRPTGPLNPAASNQNPFPGWIAKTAMHWPGAPDIFDDATGIGFVLMSADFNYNNNTQIIKGCTGSRNPAAVIQGTMAVEGTLVIWMDGTIPDPYDTAGFPFTAEGASIDMTLGDPVAPLTTAPKFNIKHVLLTSDEFTIQAQNTPSTRTFGFSGLGDGSEPPFLMEVLV